MSNPINSLGPQGIKPVAPTAPTAKPASSGDDFAQMMRDQLQQVGALQTDADDQVAKLVSGQSDNMTEVFVATRKAQVAFSLLMEIRNKLVDAYEEVRNMRV
jgi:flagellar hook-basal body complex protein FliE